MLEFAVQLPRETVGRWVLAVDAVGNRLLIVGDDKSMRWVAIADCQFLKCKNPEAPLAVVVVQPQKDQIVVPYGQLKGGPGSRPGAGPNGRQN